MMKMQFALALLSVVALSTAAPQSYTSQIQILQASTTYPTPSSTNTTIYADGATLTTGGATRATAGASNTTDKVTEASIGVTTRSDVKSPTTDAVSATTTEQADDESSTNASIKTGGGVRTKTGSAVRGDKPVDKDNETQIESGEVGEPGFGVNFKLPSYFTTILQTVPTIGSAGYNTTSSEISPNDHGNDDSDAISNSQNFNGGLTIDSTPPLTTFNSTTNTSTTTTTSPFVAVSPNYSSHNVLSTSDFNNQKTFIPSDLFEAPISSRRNTLSTSDFNNHQTPLHPEHLTRVKKSLTESKLSRNQEAIAPLSLHLSPDNYVPPVTAVGKYNSNAYNNDYYSQSFPQDRTPVVYEAATTHSGNNGGYFGQFQYIIRTSNLPGVLVTLPASASSSAIHSSSPDTDSSQGVTSTGSQSGVGHVSLASQPASHVSLLPNFQSTSYINFASNPQPSVGLTNSLKGSSLPGHQKTKADSDSGTSRPDGSYYSTTTGTSIAFHAGHQPTKGDSASGTHSPNETYYSTTTTESTNTFHAGHQQTKAGSASGTHSQDETYYSTKQPMHFMQGTNKQRLAQVLENTVQMRNIIRPPLRDPFEATNAFHAGHQQTKAGSSSGTHRPDEKYNSTTTEGSISSQGTNEATNAFHAGHQQTKAGSSSGTHSPDEKYNSTTTEGSISSQGTNQIFSTRISDSSNNVTSSSDKTTEFHLLDSSEMTTTSTVGVEETTDQKVGKGKPVRRF